MVPSRAASELLFGPTARRLNVRALALPGSPQRSVRAGQRAAAKHWFACDAQGLKDSERAALADLRGAELSVFLAHDTPPPAKAGREAQQLLLGLDADALEEASADLECAAVLLAAQRALEVTPPAPLIMGILNVTPDSFSDGGRYEGHEAAVRQGLQLEAEGARILDVGGESSRPGSEPVGLAEEKRRVLPVIERLAERASAQISIDTTKAAVAEAALDLGAHIINDISAGRDDPRMLDLAAERGCPIVLMHMQGRPRDMQESPQYGDPLAEVAGFLRERAAACLKAGIEAHKIVIDPGIGFGKRLQHNLALLRRLKELRSLGLPILMGVSRKSFIAHLSADDRIRQWSGAQSTGAEDVAPDQRIGGSAAAVAACIQGGAEILRVHDVRIMAEAAMVAWALRSPLAFQDDA